MAEPLTFVLDTNILLRLALKKTQTALNVWDALLADVFTLALSESILSELARVLRYPRIARKNNLTYAARTEFIAALRDNAVMVEELYEVWHVEEDETDNMFLACALESYADYLVSEDKHLRAIKYYHGVQIIAYDHFLKLIGL